MRALKVGLAALVVVLGLVGAGVATAEGPNAIITSGGCQSTSLPRNDDGSSSQVQLPFTLNFFGSNYNSLYVNNNGNVTFNSSLGSYTPFGLGQDYQGQPIIAPFFADVDTRGANSGLVYYNTSIANETIITWDHVGYYSANDDKLNTFQLVVRGPDFVIPQGEGQIGFFWTDMQWETGDASGGSGGFGGTPAAVGFGDGQSNGFVLEGSIQNGIARIVDHKMIWFNLNSQGEPVPVGAIPEPETYALMLGGLALVGAIARRRRRA